MIFVFLLAFVLLVSALITIGYSQQFYIPAFVIIMICLIIMLICYVMAINHQYQSKKLPGGAVIKLL